MEIAQDPDRYQPELNGVSEQVAIDLANYLATFSNASFAVRNLALVTGLNEKTIKRLLACENKPTYQTLFKLYAIFLKENNFAKLIERCPQTIAVYLQRYTPHSSVANSRTNSDFLEMLKSDPVVAELYVLAGTGPLLKSNVLWRYGQYGADLLRKMIERSLIAEISKDTYVVSRSGPNLDGPALKFLGEYFVQKYSNPANTEEKGHHTISFYAEGLNEEGKHAWLRIDSAAFYEKLKIANDPKFKGGLPVFTFTATEAILVENINV